MEHFKPYRIPTKNKHYVVPRIRLCLVSFRSLSRFATPIIQEYQTRADIEVIEATFEDAVNIAQELEHNTSIDAFISAGANAAMLRQTLETPVATIKADAYDVLLALYRAKRISNKVGLITYGTTVQELDTTKDLLKIEITQLAYTTMAEARQCVRDLIQQGHEVIVGSSFIVEAAELAGCCGILSYSPSSIRQAFDAAMELARISRMEIDRFNQINGVLSSLKDALLAVDQNNRITAINPAMEQVLNLPAGEIYGRLLDDIAPELSLRAVLQEGRIEQGQIMRFRRQEWIATRSPILQGQALAGATILLQSSQTIQEADTSLRTQRRRQHPTARYQFEDLIGNSPAFTRSITSARRFAATDLTLLLHGESGSGKELFAQAIHNASLRAGKPFIAVNCAAFPESLLESELFGYEDGAFTGSRRGGKRGLFEAAHTGTLFLDEIGDMPLILQTRLLRVLQEREIVRLGGVIPIPVDVRIIVATHQALRQMIEEGSFRQDLFYRINTLQLNLPALRDRPSDILLLAQDMLSACLRRMGSTLTAAPLLQPLKNSLQKYHWPGNVRELENMCERMAVYFCQFNHINHVDYAGLAHDCPEIFHPAHTPEPPVPIEERIRQAMLELDNNRQAVAQRLGISRTTLWRLLNKPKV